MPTDEMLREKVWLAPDGEGEQPLLRALERAAIEWRTTFDAIEHPVLLLGLDGRVRRLNRAARDLLGRAYRDLVGRHVSELMGGQPWEAVAALSARLLRTLTPEICEARDDRSARTWEVEGCVSGIAEEGEGRVIIQLRDITKTVRLQESLRRSETMAVLGAVVAGVAHEVRNPLFGMSAVLDAFENRFVDRSEYRPYLQLLRTELRRMSDLMQALLDYGKPARFDMALRGLAEPLEAALALCRPLAESRKVTLAAGEPPADALVLLDLERLTQAIKNVVENAIQHSPPGGEVALALRVLRIEGEDWLRLTVRDHGPGFSAADLPKIFEPFFSKRKGGTGLGLSIVSRAVEGHGGKVGVANHPDGGGVVDIDLPCTLRSEGG
ncbi:MAG TPA: ATP-binding protein [Thermoanaerobaculia bacterium]|nr:ATP-binding protein [Thermoanaerobaculia bacterium]